MIPPIITASPSLRIHIHLDGIIEKAIQQHRRILAHPHGFAHVALKVFVAMDDFHRATAEYVARAHHERISDLVAPVQPPTLQYAPCSWAVASSRVRAAVFESARDLRAGLARARRTRRPAPRPPRSHESTSRKLIHEDPSRYLSCCFPPRPRRPRRPRGEPSPPAGVFVYASGRYSPGSRGAEPEFGREPAHAHLRSSRTARQKTRLDGVCRS